jgi:aryl sulfotransferase
MAIVIPLPVGGRLALWATHWAVENDRHDRCDSGVSGFGVVAVPVRQAEGMEETISGADPAGTPDPGQGVSPLSASTLFHYTSDDEDSARWWRFPLRDGDIIVSTRSKSGTTWMQMICLLLVFQAAPLRDALGRLSPWLDRLFPPEDEVRALLAAQTHRRVIKTHTPLDGVPQDPRVTYIVVARHPLDAAVSMYHHSRNLDRERLRVLMNRSEQVTANADDAAPADAAPDDAAPDTAPDEATPPPVTSMPLREWLLAYIDWDPQPRQWLDSLPGTMLHLSDAWARRDAGNVVLVHYDDLWDDLDGSMRHLSCRLGIPVDGARIQALVRAAGFEAMRADPERSVPETLGVFKDNAAFFRRGGSGEGPALAGKDGMNRYRARVEGLAPPELLAWLHRDRAANTGSW